MEFHQELREWIERIIRQRNYLINKGLSRKNAYLMAENISHLKRYLNYFKYADDLKISRFFQTNHNKILSLLPGAGSKNHDIRQEEFLNYSNKTKSIIYEKTFHHRQTSFPGNIFSSESNIIGMGIQA